MIIVGDGGFFIRCVRKGCVDCSGGFRLSSVFVVLRTFFRKNKIVGNFEAS